MVGSIIVNIACANILKIHFLFVCWLCDYCCLNFLAGYYFRVIFYFIVFCSFLFRSQRSKECPICCRQLALKYSDGYSKCFAAKMSLYSEGNHFLDWVNKVVHHFLFFQYHADVFSNSLSLNELSSQELLAAVEFERNATSRHIVPKAPAVYEANNLVDVVRYERKLYTSVD